MQNCNAASQEAYEFCTNSAPLSGKSHTIFCSVEIYEIQ